VSITVILASASPRRIELIKKITDDFTVIPSCADESIDNKVPVEDIPIILSSRKALSIAKDNTDSVVIGCDTVVIANNEVLGKPKDKDDARRMIKALSGISHKVITGVTVIKNDTLISFAETTEVKFRPIEEEEIEEYISGDEPYDKAGGYAVQGIAGKFVEELIGDYYNVVGFPVNKIRQTLQNIGINVKNEA
jgi:septum formation protein